MESEQALIKEAHQRRRRRRLLAGGVFIAVVAVIAPVVGFLTQGGAAHYQTLPRATREKQLSPVRTASGVQPEQPGPLAVGSNGDLYIADHARNQILERLIDGRFRVLVGNGKAGFSGDGGPATNAEINDPEGMAVAPDGTLYFADSRNGRIRTVSPDGIITTVAGNGQSGWIADGTPALSASLTPVAVAFSPSGQLYVADENGADGGEILRLNAEGTFTRVLGASAAPGASVDSVPTDTNIDPIALAFDSDGNLFVGGGAQEAGRPAMQNTLFKVTPKGAVTYPLGAFGALVSWGYGGLVTAPDGSVLAMGQLSVTRLSGNSVQTLRSFPLSFLKLNGFSPGGIAVAPNGTVDLDSDQGNGFSWVSSIVELEPNGKAKLLWKGSKPPA
jgi:sugar lactone lactonase YvrE